MAIGKMASGDIGNIETKYSLVDRTSNNGNSGPNLMPTKPGPERELVERFLFRKPLKTFSPLSTTIYCQPRLESGVPDVVAVIWDDRVTESWSETRSELSKNEIRLLHFIYQHRSILKSELQDSFHRDVKLSLEKLLEANVLNQTRNRYYSKPLSKVFAVKRIIAIEAKMNSWSIALSQAIMNTWFASDSFVLVPKLPSKSDFPKTALGHGIRVLEENSIRFNVKP
ncbi:MAG: hypothetical protein KAV87_31510, partial [Desulfobacteraceae bacterium]|nr:hypothetical protein [Desulfobacteraceae bacterium]